jgi:pimeloyl-ACP methyl ester carboxylesterase
MQIAEEASPRFIMSADGLKIATYEWGAPDAATTVVAVHGFASSASVNWLNTGWVRDLTRAGFRVIALDQRGHGASDKPHDPAAYTMANLVADLLAVMDTYMIDDAEYAGYSLGARVGWQAALDLPDRISRAVLGGIPDGDPLTRFRVDQARAFLADGSDVEDRLTLAYLEMAGGIPGNDLAALVSLVEGMRGGVQPDPANPPSQPLLFATGSEDRIIDASRSLAAATPRGSFFEIPGRNHFNAPTARTFRDAAVEFLCAAPAVD